MKKKKRVKKGDLLPDSIIHVSIPRRFLLKCFYKQDFLTKEETIKNHTVFKDLEQKSFQIQHALSLVAKNLLKGWKEVKYKDDNLTHTP